ncbi:peptide-methionine (S)-S-oxide reductase [Salinimicrobium sp. TH3]|uniref:peptide-methionine (S)-S-oxide reductase n=1 Tax=Salinimicrobium sp. TH3 TaxID=2997342 RepID=UPI002DD42CC9|nr:peptide-methionine (S)-S-oxide reductase [Salinimicrobium sp. TH3]
MNFRSVKISVICGKFNDHFSIYMKMSFFTPYHHSKPVLFFNPILKFIEVEDSLKIGLGGGCHWCTEAIFQSVDGVVKVEQGYIASEAPAEEFSEAVIVHYLPKRVKMKRLLEIHLHTHNSTSNHSFREKYRSAIYYFSTEDEKAGKRILKELQKEFEEELVTEILPFRKFKPSREQIQDYYRKNPDAPFCKRYIEPKLERLKEI